LQDVIAKQPKFFPCRAQEYKPTQRYQVQEYTRPAIHCRTPEIGFLVFHIFPRKKMAHHFLREKLCRV